MQSKGAEPEYLVPNEWDLIIKIIKNLYLHISTLIKRECITIGYIKHVERVNIIIVGIYRLDLPIMDKRWPGTTR